MNGLKVLRANNDDFGLYLWYETNENVSQKSSLSNAVIAGHCFGSARLGSSAIYGAIQGGMRRCVYVPKTKDSKALYHYTLRMGQLKKYCPSVYKERPSWFDGYDSAILKSHPLVVFLDNVFGGLNGTDSFLNPRSVNFWLGILPPGFKLAILANDPSDLKRAKQALSQKKYQFVEKRTYSIVGGSIQYTIEVGRVYPQKGKDTPSLCVKRAIKPTERDLNRVRDYSKGKFDLFCV